MNARAKTAVTVRSGAESASPARAERTALVAGDERTASAEGGATPTVRAEVTERARGEATERASGERAGGEPIAHALGEFGPPATAVPTRRGTWGGRTQEQRRAERRERLLGAALDIWLEHGWAAVTMRGVCTRAGLNDRYFYEHFADRDDLLGAVWDEVGFQVLAELSAVVAENLEHPALGILHLAVARAVALQSDGPARILFGDHAGSRVLEQRRTALLQESTDLLIATARPYLRPGVDESDLRMGVLMGIGGFIELLTAWRNGTIEADAARIIDHVSRTADLLGAQYLSLPD